MNMGNGTTRKRVVIVGAGSAGLLAAYTLKSGNVLPADVFDIILMDKGNIIQSRICPMRENENKNKNSKCVNCKVCNITHGFGGSGTFSDCKLSLDVHEVGGNILDYVAENYVENRLLPVVEEFFCRHYGEEKYHKLHVYGTRDDDYTKIENKLRNECNLSLSYNPTIHLGTENCYDVMRLAILNLSMKGVQMYANTEVISVKPSSKNKDYYTVSAIYQDKPLNVDADYVIFAPGRSGNAWLSNMLKKQFNIGTKFGGIDFGFRVELPSSILKEVTDKLYDAKIYGYDELHRKVRTFCVNPDGFVTEEHYNNGIVLANGHSYADKKSTFTNFAALVHFNSYKYTTEDFMQIIKVYNEHNQGKLYSNDIANVPCSWRDIDFKSSNGLDLKRVFDVAYASVTNLLDSLDNAYTGIMASSTKLYSPEAKFYSDVIDVEPGTFELKDVPNIFCIGDGSGITRGIIQSMCCGVTVADCIVNRLKYGLVKTLSV